MRLVVWLAASVSSLIVGRIYYLLLVVAYLIWRIYRLRQPRVLFWAFVVVGIVCLRSLIFNYTAQQQRPLKQTAGEFIVYAPPDSWRVDGNMATATVRDNNHHRVQLVLFLKHRWEQENLVHGCQYKQVLVQGRLQPLMPSTNRYSFDAQKYYAQQGIHQQVTGEIRQLKSIAAPGLPGWLHCWRAKLGMRLDQLPSPLNHYARRLILGFADPGLQEVLKDTSTLGVIHLFCLSGMHVLVFCRLLTECLIRLHVTRERINSLQMACLPLLWLFGGQGTGLSRAILMVELTLIGNRWSKLHVDAWATSLLINLLIAPGILLTLGGQLTYLLSLALPSLRYRNSFFQSLALNLVSLPAILHAVYQFHILSLLANLIMIPLFSWVIIPGTLISCGLNFCCPSLVGMFNQGLLILQKLLSIAAHLPGMIVFGRIPGLLVILLTAITLIWVEHPIINKQWGRYGLMIYVACFTFIHFPITGEVTFVDIGQGDCAIIRCPFNHQVIMIDTGGRLHFRQAAWKRRTESHYAANSSVNYLKSHGISRIDAVCISHHDADHCGYLRQIASEIHVRSVLVPAGMEKQTSFTNKAAGLRLIPVSSKNQLQMPLAVIHPFKDGKGNNEDSMVLWGRFGGRRFIFMGDLDRAGERKIVHRYPNLSAEVIKLGHHGSKTASDPYFLKRMKPQMAIVSAGRQNRYGHPHKETLHTLKRLAIPYLSTQDKGMISYIYWGNHGYWRTQLRGDELKWMLQR